MLASAFTSATAGGSSAVTVTPGTIVNEPEPQVDFDDNGEPIAEAPGAPLPQQKKVEDDPVVKKALELLAK